MRLLEVIDSILLTLYLLWPHPRPIAIRLFPSAALMIALIHLLVEKYRWQMIPIYILTGLLTLASLEKMAVPTDWSSPASYMMAFLLALSIALPILLPVPIIPTSSGKYKVGSTSYEMIDVTRKEIYSGKDEPRRFMVQIWYPADVKSTDKSSPWITKADVYMSAISTFIELPGFFLDHLKLVKTPAYEDAAIVNADETFPVILFSHGWNGFYAQNTGQAIELASRGYVVISIQHTYGAVTTVFPDDTIAPNNPEALPTNPEDPDYEIVARKLVNQWAGDMSFVLDQFQRLNSEGDSIFFQKLNLERIGVYGHSTGAGAAIQFCATDSRCKAVLGMDPFMRPVSAEVIRSGVSKPSFFMFSELWAEDQESRNNILFHEFRANAIDNKGVIEISNTKHFDFSDVPLLSPIASHLGLKGSLKGKRVIKIVNSYLLDFFEMTLNNKPSVLFGRAFSDFLEVKVLQ